MNPFHTIAVPHTDILEGRLTQDVFAADLWNVHHGKGPDEYKDAVQFFEKTYETDGLKRLLEVVEARVRGRGGDPVIQIQTPFGGGKTHALIAMYHKVAEWNASPAVIVGTPMGGRDTLWGALETQLTGSKAQFDGLTSPGRDAIYELLAAEQPALILMDELLQYMTKADSVRVENSTLASQTLAFMQELTEAAAALEKVALVITVQSSGIQRVGEGAEKLYEQLGQVVGRVEMIYAPVQEHEITHVIRHRLFSHIDIERARDVVAEFTNYAEKESILPPGTVPSDYRKRFNASYPFQPEAIDVLYQRWGSFPNFQRTRGVLRLLSLVIHSLKEKELPYISLSDFDLGLQDIRRELLKHIGNEFDSVLAADITGDEAGAKKVDLALGNAYKGLKLGSRAATAVFLYSFSGGTEQGAVTGEIKRSTATTGIPSSVVGEAANNLPNQLFYLRRDAEKSYFTNQPNLNRILLTRMENIKDSEIGKMEEDLVKRNLSIGKLNALLYPTDGAAVTDNADLKLVILKLPDKPLMQSILETKGKTPRVNRNSLLFLTTLEHERSGFYNQLKKTIAYRALSKDTTLNLSNEQQREIRAELKTAENGLDDMLRRYYRTVFIPTREGLKEADLGVPTYGDTKKLDEVVYENLRSSGEILEKIAPLVLKERYLNNNDEVSTQQLYQSSTKTPGGLRVVNRSVWESGIAEGVKRGVFGLGDVQEGKPVCRYFKESPPPLSFTENEVIISAEICVNQRTEREGGQSGAGTVGSACTGGGGSTNSTRTIEPPRPQPTPTPPSPDSRTYVQLEFTLPQGKVSSLMGMMNLLQSKFDTLKIQLTATDGEISEQDYDDKIKEALDQLKIDAVDE